MINPPLSPLLQTNLIIGRPKVVFDNLPLLYYTILTLKVDPGIENKLAGRSVDQTDDWTIVTRQLRKYAVATGALDVLVMDEATAIYFRFPPDPAADDHFHEYLVASLVDIPTVPSDLSMREIIAFMCWRALLGKGAYIRDFGNPTGEGIGERIGESDSGGGTTSQPPPSTKRPHESSGVRTQPKRSRLDNSSGSANQVTMFNRWTLNSVVNMKIIPDFPDYPIQLEISESPDSDLRKSPSYRPEILPNTGHYLLFGQEQFKITHIITDTVAVLTAEHKSHPLYLAKLFAHPDSPELLAKEIAVYDTCKTLQGTYIPQFYGVWQITSPPAFAPIVLLTEFVGPGTTIAELRSAARDLPADSPALDEALARLSALQKTGTPAMEALHRHGVIHNDPVGRNLVVSKDELGDERVVIVDFDLAQVHTDQEVVERRARQDWAFFRNAFRV